MFLTPTCTRNKFPLGLGDAINDMSWTFGPAGALRAVVTVRHWPSMAPPLICAGTAFVLTQIEDVSPADTAALLGVTVNHLHVLLHRARARLREQLNSHQTVREARNHHE